MTRNVVRLAGISVMLALGLAFAGAPLAQTTTAVEVRTFEVISVDGNQLVLRDERGTNEYTVPSDFRFTVDGRKMSVSELKAGMKGTATVTSTTTVTPVVVTEIRHGVVLSVRSTSVTVRDDTDGLSKRFTQSQLNDRGIQIFKEGRAIHVSQLNQGDEITATIVSQLAPVVVTEQEVQATLNPPGPQSKTETTPVSPAAAVQPTTALASPQSTAALPASEPVEPSGLGATWYALIAVIIAGLVFFVARRRRG